jgi:hypothetical protein
MVYGFPDGSEVTMTIKAKIEGQTVAVKAAWPTESTAKGFARLDLKIPGDEARDLTIEANGKPTVLDFGEARYLPKTNEIVFRRTSTGAFLFKLNGEILGTAIVTDRDHPDNGALLRLDTAKVGMDSNISDEKEAGWTLSFQE